MWMEMDCAVDIGWMFSRKSEEGTKNGLDAISVEVNRLTEKVVGRRTVLMEFLIKKAGSEKFNEREIMEALCEERTRRTDRELIRKMLDVPEKGKGPKSKTIKEARERTELSGMHKIAFFRASRESTVAMGSHDGEPELTQRYSQTMESEEEEEEGDSPTKTDSDFRSGQERARLKIFSDLAFANMFFFLDCYAPTEGHAARAMQMMESRNVKRGSWSPTTTGEFVEFFWEAFGFLTSKMKRYYSDENQCGVSLKRQMKRQIRRLTNVLFFLSIPSWTAELVEASGTEPEVLESYRPVITGITGNRGDGSPLRLLSVAFRPRSKVPKQLGAEYYVMVEAKISVVVREAFDLAMKLKEVHEVPEEQLDHALREEAEEMSQRLRDGGTVLSAPFLPIWEATLEYLPRLADSVRGDVTELRKDLPDSFPRELIEEEKRRVRERKRKRETEKMKKKQGDSIEEEEAVEEMRQLAAARARPDDIKDDSQGEETESRGGETAQGREENDDGREFLEQTSQDGKENWMANMCHTCVDAIRWHFEDMIAKGASTEQIGKRLWKDYLTGDSEQQGKRDSGGESQGSSSSSEEEFED